MKKKRIFFFLKAFYFIIIFFFAELTMNFSKSKPIVNTHSNYTYIYVWIGYLWKGLKKKKLFFYSHFKIKKKKTMLFQDNKYSFKCIIGFLNIFFNELLKCDHFQKKKIKSVTRPLS